MPAWPHQQGDAEFADPDPVDHAPQFFEIDSSHQPATRALRPADRKRDYGGWQEVIVYGEAGHQDTADVDTLVAGHRDRRRTDTARCHGSPGFVEQGQFCELGKLESEVLEDAVLLPSLQAGMVEVRRDRLENLKAASDVQLDLFGGLGRHILIALDDRLARAAPKGHDGHGPVRKQRSHRRRRQKQRQARCDLRQFSVTFADARHSRSVNSTSRSVASGTTNLLFTARVRSFQAMNNAGGSSAITFCS